MKITNWRSGLTKYVLVYLCIIICWNYFFADIIYLDSIEVINNENPGDSLNIENPDFIMPPVALNKYDRLRRRVLWHWFGYSREKFDTFEEFKKSWNPSFSIKKTIKHEIKEFCENPGDFVKRQQLLTKLKIDRYMKYFNKHYNRR